MLYSAGPAGRHRRAEPGSGRALTADKRGRISVDEHFRTEVDHIYAVGDVIGFPALAATAMEQGRRASYHAFGEPVGDKLGDLQPIGIYTIPEISYVGATEEQLTDENVPFEVGVSRYRELARGAILGDSYGMLKLLVHAETRALLGVHVFGTNATELVHIGQTVMGLRRHRRLPGQRRLQLPDAGRVVQGRRARRGQQDAQHRAGHGRLRLLTRVPGANPTPTPTRRRLLPAE